MIKFNFLQELSKKIQNKVWNKVRKAFLLNYSPKWLTSPEYAKKNKAKWHKVYEKMPNRRPTPVNYGSIVVDLQRKLDLEFPEAGLLELNNALLYNSAGWVFTKEGYLLPDHSWFGRHVNTMGGVPRFLPKGRRLQGVCLSLASDHCGNYGHFLLDCISRLDLFNKAGFKLSEVDYIFCPKPPSKNAKRLFDKLGIPSKKCIWTFQNRASVIRVSTLLAPTFPGTRRNYPKWVPKFLQQEFLPSPTFSPSRRLYISRTGCRRNLVNEEAINRLLIKYNFEIYNPTQHENPPEDFAEAAIIVGPHGSGLADLAFCQPGTKVLELVPTDHVYPYFYTLSDAADLEYGYLAGQSTHERGQDAWGPSPYNFYVNEDELEAALVEITSKT